MKTKSRDASIRSRSNSSLNVDDPNPKFISKLEWDNLLSENESESRNFSQSNIQMSYKIEEEKKLENFDESWSDFNGNHIHKEDDYSDSDFQLDQESGHIQELRCASNFNEKKLEAC